MTSNKKTPPPNKQQQKSAKRVKEILAASRKLLIEEGAVKFSMRQVASRTGIHLASLQHHFPTRDDLIRATMEDSLSLQIPATNKFLANQDHSNEENVRDALRWLFEFIIQPDNASFGFQIWSLAASDEHLRDMIAQVYHSYIDLLSKLLMTSNPSLSLDEAEKRAMKFMVIMDGYMLYSSMLGAKQSSFAEMEEEFLELAIKASLNDS